MPTRDQRLATDILPRVQQVGNETQAFQKKYGTMAHKLPMLVRSAGLAQALAFVQAKSKEKSGADANLRLLGDLAGTLRLPSAEALLEQSRKADLPAYLLLSQEAMAALTWYKRFAESVLKIDPTVDLVDTVEA